MSIQDMIESDEEAREEMVPGHVQSADLSQRRRNPVGSGSRKWATRSFIDSEPDDEIPFRLVGAATSKTAIRSIQTVN